MHPRRFLRPSDMLEQVAITVLNHLLDGAPWARERLDVFAGHTARITAPPLKLHLAVSHGGWLAEASTTNFDAEIDLPASAPLAAMRGSEALLQQAHITGSSEFAEALGFVLRNLRWDVEEDLSRVVGDIAAHRIVSTGKRLFAWQKQAAQNTAENVVEYLQHERPALPTRGAVAEFTDAVDQLRDDLARLEKLVDRLNDRAAG